uniref:Uncharacterized protein n=1 Tax=Aegilops tauschii subsp. strangulata TaxID=200361 RepID=A0A453J2A0_AEGTS
MVVERAHMASVVSMLSELARTPICISLSLFCAAGILTLCQEILGGLRMQQRRRPCLHQIQTLLTPRFQNRAALVTPALLRMARQSSPFWPVSSCSFCSCG